MTLIIILTFSFSNLTLAIAKTEISYDKIPENIATGLDKFKCKGKFEKSSLLFKIGYSDTDLEKGVSCRKADFDGNGSLDYWIYKCDSILSCKSQVILMVEEKLLKVVDVQILSVPDASSVNDKDNLSKHGCKIPPTDYLVEYGDGEGLVNKIYSLDKNKNSFIEFSHCTTMEAD